VGKVKPDKEVRTLVRKFRLDEHVKSLLVEMVVRRDETRREDLEVFAQHLEYSRNPSAMTVVLTSKLLGGEWERLPDLTDAIALMKTYKLDEDARFKLCDVVRSRPLDHRKVLDQLSQLMDGCVNPSAVVCGVGAQLIDGREPPKKQLSTERSRERGDRRQCRHGQRQVRSRSRPLARHR